MKNKYVKILIQLGTCTWWLTWTVRVVLHAEPRKRAATRHSALSFGDLRIQLLYFIHLHPPFVKFIMATNSTTNYIPTYISTHTYSTPNYFTPLILYTITFISIFFFIFLLSRTWPRETPLPSKNTDYKHI